MRNNVVNLVLMLFALAVWSACEDDNKGIRRVTVPLTLHVPEGVTQAVVSEVVATMKNVTTGKTTALEVTPAETKAGDAFRFTVTVEEGLYHIMLEGNITYEFQEQQMSSKIRAYVENVTLTAVNGEVAAVEAGGFLHNDAVSASGGFVIAEIFFTGTETPEKKPYTGDKYFRIYNNASDTLYADRLLLAESEFLTTQKYDYTPDILKEAFATDAVYVVPGTGRDYPVAPGQSVLICDNAIDHTRANPNSFDLTQADFEWYDESTNPYFTDVDNPDVPNMDKFYCYTASIWGPHNRGFKSYVLARLPEDMSRERYLEDYTYHYEYKMVLPSGTFPMDDDCYQIPNAWILDAVNLSIASDFVWLLTAPYLDLGWTYCGTVDKDASRYGKSVRRKVSSVTEDGRAVLQDTNNSSVDFEPEVQANPYYVFR